LETLTTRNKKPNKTGTKISLRRLSGTGIF